MENITAFTETQNSALSSNVHYQKINSPSRVGVSASAITYASRGLSEAEGMENRPFLRGLQLKEYNTQTNPFFKPSDLPLESIHVADGGASLNRETRCAACAENSPQCIPCAIWISRLEEQK